MLGMRGMGREIETAARGAHFYAYNGYDLVEFELAGHEVTRILDRGHFRDMTGVSLV